MQTDFFVHRVNVMPRFTEETNETGYNVSHTRVESTVIFPNGYLIESLKWIWL